MLPPEKISQQTSTRWGWNTRIAPIEEVLELGPNYQSVDNIPDKLSRRFIEIAGENAPLITQLFEAIASKQTEIGTGSVYTPFIYDARNPNQPQVVGLKMSEEGAWRLAQIRLGLSTESKRITLAVENFRHYGEQQQPALVISADDKVVKVERNEDLQSVPEKEQWLDTEFHQWLDAVITQANTLLSVAV